MTLKGKQQDRARLWCATVQEVSMEGDIDRACKGKLMEEQSPAEVKRRSSRM